MLCIRGRNTPTVRYASGQRPASGLDQQPVRMPVVTAPEFYNFIPACIAPGRPHSTHNGFRTGIDQPEFFHGRHTVPYQFRQLCLLLRGRAKRQAIQRCLPHLLHHNRMGMPQNPRSPGTDIVNPFIAILIQELVPFCASDEQRRAAHTAKCPHRAVHAAWHKRTCFFI